MTPPLKHTLTSLNLIYFALIIVMVGFATFVYAQIASGEETPEHNAELETLLQYIVLAVVPAGMGIGYIAFKAALKGITPDMSLAEKLQRYQSAVIIRGAGFEMPGMLASAAAFITGNIYFLLFTAVVVVLFLLFRPTLNAVTNDLQLTATERAELESNHPFTRR
ncbi:MAG: hypothetical protein KIT62_02575 [Cyclobacteriaceae bacterium]|nr:hypothetical protein [Cyclobacteriaceae bacterium]